jgi:cell wall-associated NlpC family hydrolase
VVIVGGLVLVMLLLVGSGATTAIGASAAKAASGTSASPIAGAAAGDGAGATESAIPQGRPQVVEPEAGVQAVVVSPGAPVGDANARAPSLAEVKQALQLETSASATLTGALESSWAAEAFENGGPGERARINPDGTATAPADAPLAVKAVIAAANQIIDRPYIYAGGHSSWIAPGYDCSGAVSYALHGGGLLSAPLAVQFEGYGNPGPGKWITVYADSEHVFAAIAGLAFDTANYGGPNIPAGSGPRWRYNPTGNLADGGNFVVRHPPGF